MTSGDIEGKGTKLFGITSSGVEAKASVIWPKIKPLIVFSKLPSIGT
jgi:hypothetical protein